MSEEKTLLKGETFPVAKKAQNCQLQLDFSGANSDVPARTPPQNESVHGEKSTSSHFICSEQSRLDGTLKDAGTEGEYIRMSRRKGRRVRRQAKRLKIRQDRCEALGGLDEVFNYHDLYKAGKKCCNGVRWKQSVQQFELRLFSGTAVRRRAVLNGNYKFSPYVHFMLCERGKSPGSGCLVIHIRAEFHRVCVNAQCNERIADVVCLDRDVNAGTEVVCRVLFRCDAVQPGICSSACKCGRFMLHSGQVHVPGDPEPVPGCPLENAHSLPVVPDVYECSGRGKRHTVVPCFVEPVRKQDVDIIAGSDLGAENPILRIECEISACDREHAVGRHACLFVVYRACDGILAVQGRYRAFRDDAGKSAFRVLCRVQSACTPV